MTQAPATLLKIGELTAKSQVPIKTIRYYEEIGLIQSHGRTDGGFRLFSLDVLPRLAFIKRAQRLGLSLHEILEILAIHDQGNLPCSEVRHKFEEKIADIDQQIQELTMLKQQLLNLMAESDAAMREANAIDGAPLPTPSDEMICPIIQANSDLQLPVTARSRQVIAGH